MFWLDVAIVYLAFGAPFGVLRITAKRNVSAFAFVRSVSGFLLWPIVALRTGARFLIARPDEEIHASASVQDERESLRTELETAHFPEGAFSASAAKRDELYAFREAFFRYHGLKDANAEFDSSLITSNSSLIRSACLARRDRKKLELQLANANRDLCDIVG